MAVRCGEEKTGVILSGTTSIMHSIISKGVLGGYQILMSLGVLALFSLPRVQSQIDGYQNVGCPHQMWFLLF